MFIDEWYYNYCSTSNFYDKSVNETITLSSRWNGQSRLQMIKEVTICDQITSYIKIYVNIPEDATET